MTTYTEKTFRDAVYAAFDAYWNDLTPVAFPNVEFKAEELEAWARVVPAQFPEPGARWGQSTASVISEATGEILVQCFVRQNTDTDMALAMADRAYSFFARNTVPGVHWRDLRSPREIGPDGPWYQVAVRCGWRYFHARPD